MFTLQDVPTISSAQPTKQIAAITGANGFIGKHLIAALQAKKTIVVPIPHELLYLPDGLKIALKNIEPTQIYHLAAYGNHIDQTDDSLVIKSIIGATWELLSASENIPYKAFINVSSSSVTLPYETVYSASKAGAERLCLAFAVKHEKPVVSVRPYSVYGQGEADFRFIPTVFRSCLQGEAMTLDPGSIHDWIYVSDFVDHLVQIAKHADTFKRQALEVGTGIATPNQLIVDMIQEIVGKRANVRRITHLRPYDSSSWVMDRQPSSKMVKVYDGLVKCYDYYKQRYTQ